MILLSDTEVEIHSEPETEGIEVGFATFHGGGAFAFKEADFPGVDGLGITEQVPGSLTVAFIGTVAEVRTGNNLKVFIGKDVQCRTDSVVWS